MFAFVCVTVKVQKQALSVAKASQLNTKINGENKQLRTLLLAIFNIH
jgi:hypothetical protein